MGILGSLKNIIGLDDVFSEIGKTARQMLPDERAQQAFDLQYAEIRDRAQQRIHEQITAQLAVNKAEAGHASIFVAGWRPFIGWICGLSLAYSFICVPMLGLFIPDVPNLPIEHLIGIIATMLGSSGLRTYEKLKGAARSNFGEDAEPVSLFYAEPDLEPLRIADTLTPTEDTGETAWMRN